MLNQSLCSIPCLTFLFRQPISFCKTQDFIQRNPAVHFTAFFPRKIASDSQEIAFECPSIAVELPDRPGRHRVEDSDEYLLGKLFRSCNRTCHMHQEPVHGETVPVIELEKSAFILP